MIIYLILIINLCLAEHHTDYVWEKREDKYIRWWPVGGQQRFDSLTEAKQECLKIENCGGITLDKGFYEPRRGPEIKDSTSREISWIRTTEKTGYLIGLTPFTHEINIISNL